MAQIHATASAVVATARALLALADDPSEVEFTHGPQGPMFVVSDALAEKLMASTEEDEAKEQQAQVPVELEKPDAPVVTAPPTAPVKANPRAKVSKE